MTTDDVIRILFPLSLTLSVIFPHLYKTDRASIRTADIFDKLIAGVVVTVCISHLLLPTLANSNFSPAIAQTVFIAYLLLSVLAMATGPLLGAVSLFGIVLEVSERVYKKRKIVYAMASPSFLVFLCICGLLVTSWWVDSG